MLMCSQLKLYERRSVQEHKRCNFETNPNVILRPCTQKNILEGPAKVFNNNHSPERRMPELRVVSLNQQNQIEKITAKKIFKSEHKMPLFCAHYKSNYKLYQKDKNSNDDGFIVRGYEVGTFNLSNINTNVPKSENEICIEANEEPEEEFKYIQNGIHIQLTDCCQCVCDLFNSSFQISHEENDFSFTTIENCNSMRPFKPKDVDPAQLLTAKKQNTGILDPDILKVIRVTMNTKR